MDEKIQPQALEKISYGLYLVSVKGENKDNACVINAVFQVSDEKKLVALALNKRSLTHDMIAATGAFCLSILSESVSPSVIERFGYQSGRDTDKFDGFNNCEHCESGLMYISKGCSAFISAKLEKTIDCATHTIFVGEVTECRTLSGESPATYRYYSENIKGK